MPFKQLMLNVAADAGHAENRAEPFTKLRVPKLFNLRSDPYERADVTSNTDAPGGAVGWSRRIYRRPRRGGQVP